MRPRAPLLPTSPTRRALAICAAALLVRLVYYLMIRETACLDINLEPISDMEAFHRWALTIIDGDWLGRGDFHPFHPWQAAVAAREQWGMWYGHVYHQEPFYPYLVALIYLIAPREPSSVIVLQLVLGAAGCAFTYLAARHLVPEGAAVTAGILSILYGPYLYYESLLLRDTFLIPLNALILWILLEAIARSEIRRARAWWAAAGLLLGVAFLTKASVLPFMALLIGWVLLRGRGLALRERAAPVLMIVAGFALAVWPVFARNVAVGAPMMKITTRGPIEFINGNNPWHMGIGWFDGDDARVSTYAREILESSGGGLPSTAAAVVSGWSGNPGGLLKLQMVKAFYFFAPFEMPNNASYSYFRLECPLLRCMLSFYWISPLALAGLVASWERRNRFMPVYLFLVSGIMVTIAFYVIARFRAPFIPAILILASWGFWWTVDQVRRARRGRAGLAVTLVALGFAVNTAHTYPDEALVRPQDFVVSIRGYLSRGKMTEALSQAEMGRRIFPGMTELHKAAGRIHLAQGRRHEAIAAFREALARNPADTESRRELLRLEAAP